MKLGRLMLMLTLLFALGCGGSDWNPVAVQEPAGGSGSPECDELAYLGAARPPHCFPSDPRRP